MTERSRILPRRLPSRDVCDSCRLLSEQGMYFAQNDDQVEIAAPRIIVYSTFPTLGGSVSQLCLSKWHINSVPPIRLAW